MHAKCLFFFALSVGCFLFQPPNTLAKEDPTSLTKGNSLITENKGQISDQFGNPRNDIDFRLVGKGVNLFIGSGHLHYQWSAAAGHSSASSYDDAANMYRMDVTFIGANKNALVSTEGKQSFYERHYTATGSEITSYAYSRITYHDIYPNIDWILYVKNGIPEYDFVIHPGGEVSDIVMVYKGNSTLNVNENGSLTATTPMGFITEQAPIAFQSDSKPVRSRFVLNGNEVRFRIAPYSGTLTIDPSIDWGTYVGGSLYDQIYQAVCDDSGYVYVAGSTASTANIVTTGSYQTTYGGGTGATNYLGDAFVAKFNSSGICLWSTYYGGSTADQGMSVAIDTGRNVYLSGFTQSTSGIATTGSHQDVLGGGTDAFLAKFDNAGSRLWATYYGGTGNENIKTSVSCDTFGNVYLSGITTSTSGIASSGSFQGTAGGGNDAFLVKFNAAGVRQWGTYYGGSGTELGFQHANDIYGNVYLVGYTTSTSGIATSASFLNTAAGGEDGFIVKFNSAGQRIWGTYYGGGLLDRTFGVVCDDSTNVYVTGITKSTNGIATTGAHLTTFAGGSQDVFIARFDSSGARQWGTYFGGSGSDVAGASICKGLLGSIYVCGSSPSTSGIATTGAISTVLSGSSDAYLTKFSSNGTQLWGSYIGGPDVEVAYSVAADKYGNVYLAGQTNSGTSIATSGSHQSSLGGGTYDGFLIKIYDCDTPAQPGAITGPATVCKGGSYTYSVPLMTGVTSYSWTLPSGWSGSSNSNSITVTAGAVSGPITVVPNTPCVSGPAQSLSVNVNLVATISPSGYQEVCTNDSLTLTANTGAGYTWQWLLNGAPISGATSSTYHAKSAGKYTVAISNSQCADTSIADTVSVNPLPAPVVTLNGTDLITGSYVSYQWFHGGTAITGAVNQTFTPPANGHYSVRVADTNGCNGMSAAFPYGDVSYISPLDRKHEIHIYPNPATTRVYVRGALVTTIVITDLLGRSLLNSQLPADGMDVSNLPGGIYLIRCLDQYGRTLAVEKLEKSNR